MKDAWMKVEFMANIVTIDQSNAGVNSVGGVPTILILGFSLNDFINQVCCPMQFWQNAQS